MKPFSTRNMWAQNPSKITKNITHKERFRKIYQKYLRITSARFIRIALSLSALCALYFSSRFLIRFIEAYEDQTISIFIASEAIVVCLLWFGLYAAARQTRRLRTRNQSIEIQLQTARGGFHNLMKARFRQWNLTPAECDVALLILKGMSTSEIATLRQAAEGTIKSQSSSIYSKAQVTGRVQLISGFIEELTDQAEEQKSLEKPEAF